MLKIGCHLSSSKGYEAMAKMAVSIKADTFQFFTRNPRGTKAKAIKEAFFGPITPQVPASILQLHRDVTLVADEAALSLIFHGDPDASCGSVQTIT